MFQSFRFPQHAHRKLSIVLFLIASLLAVVLHPAHAEVRLPNGEYRTSVTDLQVKVLGGSIAIERTWQAVNLNKGEFRWFSNPAWSDLTFKYEGCEGEACSILRSVMRAGAEFEKKGENLFVLKESDRGRENSRGPC